MTARSLPVRKRKVTLKVRDSVVLNHLGLVKAIAIRVHENLPVHVELDDLIHAGVLGLFDAIEKYDAGKSVEFQSYAKHRIKGAILDSLREADWASRDMRRRQKKVDAVAQDFAAKLGRTPTESEIAEELGVSTERWRRMALELRNLGVVSTTAREDFEQGAERDFPADSNFQPDQICQRRQMRDTLDRVMGALPTRYQRVVSLYYAGQLTMKEIGDKLGVNESRISQIHKSALKKMQVVLASEGIHSAAAL